ncbi:hypothetical protein F5Y10DRAFT_247062 [Nemania abortiva]|nr:hypothetical protein F5Y10DRAFT_247062 [Nemania abortiva]
MLKKPPPSLHSRVFMVIGPCHLVNEPLLRSIFNLMGSYSLESVKSYRWGDGMASMVWSFASYPDQALPAWNLLLLRKEKATSGGKLLSGWEKVTLLAMKDPCDPQ